MATFTYDFGAVGSLTFLTNNPNGNTYEVVGISGSLTLGNNSTVTMSFLSPGPYSINDPGNPPIIINADNTLDSSGAFGLGPSNIVAMQGSDGLNHSNYFFTLVTGPSTTELSLIQETTGNTQTLSPYVSLIDLNDSGQNTNLFTAACFALGTLISTPTGSTPVQDLQIGDLILNHVGQSVPVKWIGRQRLHPVFAGDNLPICIRQGALGNDLPIRDLFVSPGHAMYFDQCLLVNAKVLVNGTSITQVTQWEGDVQYFHIETEHHEIILAEGAPTETFMDNISRTCFNNHSEYQELYPQAHEMIELDIPRVSHQRQLPNTVKHKLEAISEVLMGEVKGWMVG